MIARLQKVAEECDATVRVEEPVRINGVVHYVDLTVRKNGLLAVCEAEREPARVGKDREKAVALDANYLFIPAPDTLTAQACRRKLRRLPPLQQKLKVFVCPLGNAIEILRSLLTNPPAQPPTSPQPGKES
jgi:hypothetical protein